LIVSIEVPWLAQFFDTVSLGAAEWKMVITAGFIPLVTAEVLKFVGMTFSIRRREARRAG
jgi:hypothetical protein